MLAHVALARPFTLQRGPCIATDGPGRSWQVCCRHPALPTSVRRWKPTNDDVLQRARNDRTRAWRTAACGSWLEQPAVMQPWSEMRAGADRRKLGRGSRACGWLLQRSTAPLKRVREENYCEKFLRFRAESPGLARPMTRSRIHQLVTDELSCSSCENQMFPQLSAS